MFQKALDPDSVVRESEYARSPEGQALINKIPGFVDKLEKGGVGMTDSELQQFVDAARILENAASKTYSDFYSAHQNLVSGFGMDPAKVLGMAYEPKSLTPSAQGQTGGDTG